ncbi:MAG: DUF1302 family protein [Rhodoferax sp.]
MVNMQKHGKATGFVFRPIALAAMTLVAVGAQAAEIDVGNPEVAVRWDNTVKYSVATRLKDADPTLLSRPNNDDGDRNFGKGLISNRLDLFSELDVTYQKRYGLRVSAAAWNDSVYNSTNDNPGFSGGAFPNQSSVAFNQFTDATREVHGRNAELLDAFVFGKFDLDGRTATARAGRHGLLWGESVFFGVNAIAGGQMPVDVVKLVSVPNTQFKEAIRPVPMVSGQIQLSSTMSVGAYLQTSFAPNRLLASGSYFSNSDPVVEGGENIRLGGPLVAGRTGDIMPKNSGQGGVQLRVRGDETDYGFYAIRFHNKLPQVVVNLGVVPGVGVVPTSYTQVYHEGITAFGASASRTFGDYNVAIEGSFRQNQDLASSQAVNLGGLGLPAANNSDNPGYAVGNTAHVNLSVLGSLGPNPLWKEATLIGELAWNRVLSITKNAAAGDPNATRDGVALRMVLEPTYRGVFDGVDIGVPIGIGWAPDGSRPLAMNPNAWIPEGGGDMSVGLNASFHDAWRFTLAYTHYYGEAKTLQVGANNAFSRGQTLKDRDFIAASLRYSF